MIKIIPELIKVGDCDCDCDCDSRAVGEGGIDTPREKLFVTSDRREKRVVLFPFCWMESFIYAWQG